MASQYFSSREIDWGGQANVLLLDRLADDEASAASPSGENATPIFQSLFAQPFPG